MRKIWMEINQIIHVPWIQKMRIVINDEFYIIGLLYSIVLLFNINTITQVVCSIVILVICILLDLERLLYTYIFMAFFEESLIADFLGGSVSRIILVIVLIRTILTIYNKKIKISRNIYFLISFFMVTNLYSVFFIKLNIEDFLICFNILSFCLFYSIFVNENNNKKKNIFKNIQLFIVMAIFGSIIYGVITNNFLVSNIRDVTTIRFKGIYEPNFMAMYINLGIIALLYNDHLVNKKIRYLFLIIFIIALLATVSMTGYLVFGFILCTLLKYNFSSIKTKIRNMYSFLIKKKTSLCLIIIILVSVISFGGYTSYKILVDDTSSVDNRFEDMLILLKERDFDKLSTGRIPLFREFAEASVDRPIFEILLGNGPSAKKIYSNYYAVDKYVHNSYMDFMYSFGLVGFVIIIKYLYTVMRKVKFLSWEISERKYIYLMQVSRLSLLIYALTLSLYSKRIILLFFLL